MKKLFFCLLTVWLLSLPLTSSAQCPMCKGNVKSGQNQGSNVAKGLNAAILYMLGIPFAAVAGLGIYWYRTSRKNETTSAS